MLIVHVKIILEISHNIANSSVVQTDSSVTVVEYEISSFLTIKKKTKGKLRA